MSGVLAAVLALAILGYDAGLKHTRLGPEVMGACRGLNLLLGMTHAAALEWPGGVARPRLGLCNLCCGHHRGQPFLKPLEARANLAGRRTGVSR